MYLVFYIYIYTTCILYIQWQNNAKVLIKHSAIFCAFPESHSSGLPDPKFQKCKLKCLAHVYSFAQIISLKSQIFQVSLILNFCMIIPLGGKKILESESLNMTQAGSETTCNE